LIFIFKIPILREVLICHCHGITDRRIREAARQRGLSLSAIARDCAAGTDCGGCRSAIRQILADEKAKCLAAGCLEAERREEAVEPVAASVAAG
jgi:bacterioferritin-associated ferredoxin